MAIQLREIGDKRITVLKRPPKGRYNLSLDVELVNRMDRTACILGCSRSQFVELCVNLWYTQNPDISERSWVDYGYGKVLVQDA